VLDFQDAVYGPITYDIACLMRDAFLSWDEEFVLDVTVRYWQKARKAGLPVDDDFGEFYRAVEWMGLQRHLKVAGIFARLTLRDGKPKYLADTPRFIAYIRATASRYRELGAAGQLVDQVEGTRRPAATPSAGSEPAPARAAPALPEPLASGLELALPAGRRATCRCCACSPATR
jgi:aminoglycoside/choline kinase family phosphotransferase